MANHDRNGDGGIMMYVLIGAGAVAGHLVGQAIRPIVQENLGLQPTAEGASERMADGGDIDLGFNVKDILPGVAVALAARTYVGSSTKALAAAAFLGSAALTAISGTEYDEQLRGVIKRFAPMGQFLA